MKVIDLSNMPDAYSIQYMRFVQARKHKKKRINKKWIKQYGYKQVLTHCKGWRIEHLTDGSTRFIK